MTTDSTRSGTARSVDDLEADYRSWSSAAAAVLAKSKRTTVDELPDTPEAMLSTPTRDGVTVRPLYTRKDEAAENGLPGAFPYVRGADPARDVNQGWRVTERFGDDASLDAAAVNVAILDAAGSGASGLWLKVGAGVRFGDLAAALAGVYLDLMPVTLDAGGEGIAVAHEFLKLLAAASSAPLEAAPSLATTHSLGLSPYTAAFSGRPSVPADQATALAVDVPERVRTFRVDGTDFAQAGASNAQEIGFVAAAALTHVRDLTAVGLTPAAALAQISFAVAVGDDQFASIAKLRALRVVWARIAQVLGAPEAGGALTHAVTDLSMLTQRDPWVNMLRTTVAAFGAGVGGADQVTVLGYDAALPLDARTSSASFSARIARNTQLLLLEESNIGRVLDPAGGSWHVESLTDDLARAAWEVFTGAERLGGFPAALDAGSVDEQVAAALAERESAVAHRRAPITGVSEFPNLGEPDREPGTASSTDVPTATDRLSRVARSFEELRDRADAAAAAGRRPSVLLLPLGSVAEHNGRTTFIANLLAAGGISAVNPGPVEPGDVAGTLRQAQGAGATVAVLCGTKARYESDGAAVADAARAAGVGRLLLAGPAKEWPDGAGELDGALRAGIDAVATLAELLDYLDVPSTAGASA
ncbi:MAG: methylmalonyl-CoA mutase family protein [Gordonia sp. (in: high G+C Gram-positive bacteria)]